MIDEEELRDILQRRASTMLATQPVDSAKVVRRGRSRQFLTGSVSILVAVGLAIGAFAGIKALDFSRGTPMVEPSPSARPSPSAQPSPEASMTTNPYLEPWPYEGYPRLVARSTLPRGLRSEVGKAKVIAVAPHVWQEYFEGRGTIKGQAIRGQAYLFGCWRAMSEYMEFQRDSLGTNPFPGTISGC